MDILKSDSKRLALATLATIFIFLLVCGGFALISTQAVAQQENQTEGIEIDGFTTILDYEFSDGQITLTIESEIQQSITLSDALAGVGQEGITEIPTTTKTLESGVNEIEFDVTEYRGDSAVSFSTPRASVMISDEGSFTLFEGQAGWSEVYAGAIAVFLGMLITLGAVGFKKYYEDEDDIKKEW